MRRHVVSIFIALLLIPAMNINAREKGKNQENVIFGTARINITPEKPTLMAGYSDRDQPFKNVHDSLYASAFYFSGQNIATLLITADIIGFPNDVVDELSGRISKLLNIPEKNIMITAVHNHGGPIIGKRGGDASIEYTAVLQEKLVKLSAEAARDAGPFLMGMGKGYCNLNINRRAEFGKGEIWLGRNPDGPCDHELDVVKFETPDHKLKAVLVNWPCHGTATGGSNNSITGDWPGAAAAYIREYTGINTVTGVTAGASGDINPIYGPGNSFSEVNATGYHVGSEAVRVLGEIQTFPVTTLQALDTTMIFPGKKPVPDRFPRQTYEQGDETSVRISSFRIGKLVLAGISGELMNEIGSEVRKRSPYTNTIIMTHCNGSSGYICTDKAFTEGGYEVMVTRLMPGAEQPLVRSFEKLISSF